MPAETRPASVPACRDCGHPWEWHGAYPGAPDVPGALRCLRWPDVGCNCWARLRDYRAALRLPDGAPVPCVDCGAPAADGDLRCRRCWRRRCLDHQTAFAGWQRGPGGNRPRTRR